MDKLNRAVALGLLALILSSCGGSGGGASSGTGGVPPKIASISSTTVSVESTVPAPVVNGITEVVSPISSGPLSSSIQIATSPSRDSFVLALDATGKIWLASVTSTGTTNLSAESTALALVRMAIGALPSGLSASQANQAIRATAEFPALVALIQGALDTTQAPLDSGPVVQSVATTVRQAMSAVSAILVPTPASPAPSAVAFASPPVTTPLPFKIVSNIASLFSVYVSSTGSGGSVNVVNASPIVWSAHSLNETGTLIPDPSTEDGKVLLEANSVARSLLDKVHPWLGPPSVNLPGNSGKGLDLVVEQTTASRRENLSEIMEGAFEMVVPIELGSECRNGIAEALLTAESLNAFAQGAAIDAFRDALVSDGGGNDEDLGGIIAACVPSLTPKATEVGRFARMVAKALTGLAAVQEFDDAATFAAKVVLTAINWNTSRPVAVCLGEAGFFRAPEIQNCAARFTFENPAPILVPNARFAQRVTARTEGGDETGMPIGVNHASSDAAQVVVTVLTPQTGELVANGPGSATITVRDPFSNASGQYNVTVVRPVIRPGVVRMGVGQAMSLSLTDSAGNLVITDGSGLTWTLENETRGTSSTEPVAVLGPFSGGATNTANIYARAPGRVTITVRIPVLLDPITADIEVFAAPLNVCEPDVPTYAPSGCELSRLVARNPYTPIPAGQAVPLSDLFLVRSGTCPVDYIKVESRQQSGLNWVLNIPEPYRSYWSTGHINFFPLYPGSLPASVADMSIVSLQPTASGQIGMPMHFVAGNTTGPTSDSRSLFLLCRFQQELSGGGP